MSSWCQIVYVDGKSVLFTQNDPCTVTMMVNMGDFGGDHELMTLKINSHRYPPSIDRLATEPIARQHINDYILPYLSVF